MYHAAMTLAILLADRGFHSSYVGKTESAATSPATSSLTHILAPHIIAKLPSCQHTAYNFMEELTQIAGLDESCTGRSLGQNMSTRYCHSTCASNAQPRKSSSLSLTSPGCNACTPAAGYALLAHVHKHVMLHIRLMVFNNFCVAQRCAAQQTEQQWLFVDSACTSAKKT